jgi:hypothetical protein
MNETATPILAPLLKLKIFHISYVLPEDKTSTWKLLYIAAPSLRDAVDEAERQGVSLDMIRNIADTKQMIHGVVLSQS